MAKTNAHVQEHASDEQLKSGKHILGNSCFGNESVLETFQNNFVSGAFVFTRQSKERIVSITMSACICCELCSTKTA